MIVEPGFADLPGFLPSLSGPPNDLDITYFGIRHSPVLIGVDMASPIDWSEPEESTYLDDRLDALGFMAEDHADALAVERMLASERILENPTLLMPQTIAGIDFNSEDLYELRVQLCLHPDYESQRGAAWPEWLSPFMRKYPALMHSITFETVRAKLLPLGRRFQKRTIVVDAHGTATFDALYGTSWAGLHRPFEEAKNAEARTLLETLAPPAPDAPVNHLRMMELLENPPERLVVTWPRKHGSTLIPTLASLFDGLSEDGEALEPQPTNYLNDHEFATGRD